MHSKIHQLVVYLGTETSFLFNATWHCAHAAAVSQSVDQPTDQTTQKQPIITAATTTTPDTKRAGQVVVTEEVSVLLEGWPRNARAAEGF